MAWIARRPTESAKTADRKPRLTLLYQYMYPDDVVSAHHFAELAEDLAASGWEVEALPCNRGRHDESRTYERTEVRRGVAYNRIWRPRLRQESFLGRLGNAAWMVVAWSGLALRPKARRPDIVLVGTDPIFAVAVAVPLKLLAPGILVAHWCFDMHPEAAFASGLVPKTGVLAGMARWLMRMSYRRCDLIADLGPCMRARLRSYGHGAREVGLTPWALAEPLEAARPDPDARRQLFGEARLALLYSGTFGQAHGCDEILSLARALRDTPDICFRFSVRGNRTNELASAIGPDDRNVEIVSFAPFGEHEGRLGAADIHLASLRPDWTGLSVPSKFFGSLAVGRPVLFTGPTNCAIARWIERFDVGWVVTRENIHDVAERLRELADRPDRLAELQARAHAIYRSKFSRLSMTADWHVELSDLLFEHD